MIMKTDCIIVILSTISLVISIGVFLCIANKGEGVVIKDFQGWAITVLMGIVALLLGWNIYTAIDIKQEWKEYRKECDAIMDSISSLQLEKFNSRANLMYANAVLYIKDKDCVNALNCALQSLSNMLPDYKTNKELDNFSKIEDIIRICIALNNQRLSFTYQSEDANYLIKVIATIKEQDNYIYLKDEFRETIEKLSVVESKE